jgi:hypothetical protein
VFKLASEADYEAWNPEVQMMLVREDLSTVEKLQAVTKSLHAQTLAMLTKSGMLQSLAQIEMQQEHPDWAVQSAKVQSEWKNEAMLKVMLLQLETHFKPKTLTVFKEENDLRANAVTNRTALFPMLEEFVGVAESMTGVIKTTVELDGITRESVMSIDFLSAVFKYQAI